MHIYVCIDNVAGFINGVEIINHWMSNGVRFQSAQNSYVELGVTISPGTFIGEGAQLYGNTDIGTNCHIEPFTVIDNSTIGDNTLVKSFSIIRKSRIKSNDSIGPFANINSDTAVSNENIANSFVEIKAGHKNSSNTSQL